MADRIGQHFGDYRLVRLIGQGDFGEVYLGEHLRHSGQAAIKVLHTRLRDVDALYFLNEERRIYNLKHPHVVRLLDYDFKDDIPFLIMDYLPNGTLRQRYPEGTLLPLADILSSVKQVAEVLQYAHDKNLIHCGIKPENMLLLGRNNVVLLSDFCLPLIVRSSYSQGKQAMSIRTVNYLAPEQIQGHPGPASDQYALGIVVYEWINGARPFDGSSPEIIRKHLTMLPPPLRDKNPWLPNAIEQVVLTALAKNPKGRFPSVQDFANALEQAILSHPIDTSAPNLPLPFPPEFPIIPVSPHSFTRRDALRWGLVILAGAITTTTIIAVVEESHAHNPLATPTPETTTRPSATPPHPGTTIYTIDRHPANVFQVAWSPDGKRITAGWDNNMALVWEADSGNKVLLYNHHTGKVKTVAWSPTSRYIASGGFDNTVRVWDSSTGRDILLPPYRGHMKHIRSVAWSPDGNHIASAGEDHTVRVWDASSGRDILLPPYRGHHQSVWGVAWSPDGTRIASGGFDGTVQVWQAE